MRRNPLAKPVDASAGAIAGRRVRRAPRLDEIDGSWTPPDEDTPDDSDEVAEDEQEEPKP